MTLSLFALPFRTHAYQLVGWMLLTVGLLQALPHLTFAVQTGFELCLTGGASTLFSFLGSQAAHCWGCAVLLGGVGIIASDLVFERLSDA